MSPSGAVHDELRAALVALNVAEEQFEANADLVCHGAEGLSAGGSSYGEVRTACVMDMRYAVIKALMQP